MQELDYWRLCDELNIVQASLLIVGHGASLAEYVESWPLENRPEGYEAAKTALTHALKSYARYCEEVDHFHRVNWADDQHNVLEPVQPHSLTGRLSPLYETDINGNRCSALEGSIDLWESTVDVSALKIWLKERGFTSGFFSPAQGETPDYLDSENPRYAPKLAAAVHAWLAVTDSGKKSPKQALDKWLRENATQFGLTDDEGLPINQAVQDCSKVANWQQGGGAPKTPI